MVGVNQQSSQQFGYTGGSQQQTQQQQSSSSNATDLFHTNHNVTFSALRRSSRPKDLNIDLTIFNEQSSPYSAPYMIQPHHQHIQQQQQIYTTSVNASFQSQQRTGNNTPHTYPFLTSHISSPNQHHTLVNNTTAFTFPPPQSPVQQFNSVPASPNNNSNLPIVTSPRYQKLTLIQQTPAIQHSYNQQTQQSQVQLCSPLLLNHTNSQPSTPTALNSNSSNTNTRLLAPQQWSNNVLSPLLVARLNEHSMNVSNDQNLHYNTSGNNNNRIDVNNDDDDEDPSASIDALVADVDTSNVILQQPKNQSQSTNESDQAKQPSQDQPHHSQTSPLYIRGHSQVLNTPPNPLALDDHPDNHIHRVQHQPILSPSSCKNFQQSFSQSSPLHSAGFQLNNNDTSARSKAYFTFDTSVTLNKVEQQTLNDTVFNTSKDLTTTLNNHHHLHGKPATNSDNEDDRYDNTSPAAMKPLMINTDCNTEKEQNKNTAPTSDMIVDQLLSREGTTVESTSQRISSAPVAVPLVGDKKSRKKMESNRTKTSASLATNSPTQTQNPFQFPQNRHCCTYTDCTKVFANKSALAKHKLTHSQDRRHKCERCNKGFKRLDHLHGHMLTHEEDKPHKCKVPGCSRTYCDARSLKRHIENQHQDILAAIHEGGHEDYKQYLPETAYVKTKQASTGLQGDHSIDSIDSPRSAENLEQSQQEFNMGAAQKSANKILPTYTFDEEKCVQCQLCKKTFKNGAALNGHMRLHGGFSSENKQRLSNDDSDKKQGVQQSSNSKKRSIVTGEDSEIKGRTKRKHPDDASNNTSTPPTLVGHSSFVNCFTPDSAHCSSSTTPLSTASISPPLIKQEIKRPPLHRSFQVKSEEKEVNDDYLHFTSIHSQPSFHPLTTRYDDKSRTRSISSSVIEQHTLSAYATKNSLNVLQQERDHQISHQLNPLFKHRKQQSVPAQSQLFHHKNDDNMRNIQGHINIHHSMDLLNHPANNTRMIDNGLLAIPNQHSPYGQQHQQHDSYILQDNTHQTVGLPGGLRLLSAEHQYDEKLRKVYSDEKYLNTKSLSHDHGQRNPVTQAIIYHHFQQQQNGSQKKGSDTSYNSHNYGSHPMSLQHSQQHQTHFAKKQNNGGNNNAKHHSSQMSIPTFHPHSHSPHMNLYPSPSETLDHVPQHPTTNHLEAILRNQIISGNYNNKVNNGATSNVPDYITSRQIQQAASARQQNNNFNQIKPEKRYPPSPSQQILPVTDFLPFKDAQEHLKSNHLHSPQSHELHTIYHPNDNSYHRTPSTSPYHSQHTSPYSIASLSTTPPRLVSSPASIDHQQQELQAQRSHSHDKLLVCSTINTPRHSPLSDHYSPHDNQQSASEQYSVMTTPIHQHPSPTPISSSSSSSYQSSPSSSCIVPKKRKYTLPINDIDFTINTSSTLTKSNSENNADRQQSPFKTMVSRKKNNSISYSTSSTFEPAIDIIVAPKSVHSIDTTFTINSTPPSATLSQEKQIDETNVRIDVHNTTADNNKKSLVKVHYFAIDKTFFLIEKSSTMLKVVPALDEIPITCDISIDTNSKKKTINETDMFKPVPEILISMTSSSDKTPSSNSSSLISSSSSNAKHFQYEHVSSTTETILVSRPTPTESHQRINQPIDSPSFLWPSQPSQLRRQQSFTPYTPPPMLSPYRKGSGLYYHVFSATPTTVSTPVTTFSQGIQQPFTPLTNKLVVNEINKQENNEIIPIPKSAVSIEDLLARINVGEQYQADIPECNVSDTSYDTSDELLFSPYDMSNISEELFGRLEKIINKNVLCPSLANMSYPLELIYMLLYEFRGDLELTCLTLLEGKTTSIKECRPLHTYKFPECDIWTRQEIDLYNQSIVEYEKNFELISKSIGTKTIKECIEYYYMPKKQMNLLSLNGKRKRPTKSHKCTLNSQLKQRNFKDNLNDDTSSSSSMTIVDNNRMEEENNNETNFICKVKDCQLKFDTERSYRAHRNEHRRSKTSILPTKLTNND
ncbi:unnamed protein product [Didymodactylos carnosus]|uniref:Uncharacterized protein n=1 Tax=Didymodactylos carnosus TaxID=1234261 RepID=A0A814AXE5_9BILA|nr:unnamed protein product [Didymodactylos carnosus]CAF0918883.1 unnamed protein product [Didymodactylos carnosus]CAF3530466.1 unnamed protein product [Didymodactylos carnosus]CAF3698600.1 unnamed protein product [Didymodactylos carnosus]